MEKKWSWQSRIESRNKVDEEKKSIKTDDKERNDKEALQVGKVAAVQGSRTT